MKEKRFAYENLPEDYQVLAEAMNLDNSAIPAYDLPQLPITEKTTVEEFENSIRPHLLDEFYRSMYGVIPPCCEKLEFKVVSEGSAYNGLAIRREIDIICSHKGDSQTLRMLLYIPAGRKGKVPCFFGLNFRGNMAVTPDEEVTCLPFTPAPKMWSLRYDDRRVNADERGILVGRWDIENVVKRGFATATICYSDIYLDRPDGFPGSIMRFFYTAEEWESDHRPSGAISAWAWGIMRALDCLSEQAEIDSSRFIVHGHSRLGKTALWTGANDPRVWLTVSNCSGTGGAKLSHRYYGEDFAWLDVWNKHWFCSEFRKYVNRELEYPVDQHFLMAAIAPRLLYIASGTLDYYADPEGEYLSGKHASAAWNVYGMEGLEKTEYPAAGNLIGENVGYYLRDGEHNFTPENWNALMTFVEKHL